MYLAGHLVLLIFDERKTSPGNEDTMNEYDEYDQDDPIADEALLDRKADAWIGSSPVRMPSFTRFDVERPTSGTAPATHPITPDGVTQSVELDPTLGPVVLTGVAIP